MASENQQRALPGTVALVGSGEYLPVMNEVDTYLLKTLEGAHPPRIALLPTASGLERKGPKSWNDLGLNHFKQLGVSDIRATSIIDYKSANDPAQVALLEGCNFFYFSGGNPNHAIDSLRDTLAWQSIQAAYERGAVLAGCSAGAMLLSGCTISPRQVLMGGHAEVVAALAIVPHLIVLPHFDRMAGLLSEKRLQRMFSSLPSSGYTIVGVDEETALVRVELDVEGAGQDRWRVMGRQTVTIFGDNVPKIVLKSGEDVLL